MPSGTVVCKDECGFLDTRLCHTSDDCIVGQDCTEVGTASLKLLGNCG